MSIKSLIGGLSVKASRTTAKAVLGLKKAAPEILLVGGIGVIIGGVYLACKETLQSEDILEEAGEKIEKVKTTMNDSELGYSEELARKAKVKIYAKTAGKLCKLYAPAALCVGGGIAMILKSHGIMKDRQLAAVAAYNILQNEYNHYRERVREDAGIEKDIDYKIGRKNQLIDIVEEDNEGNQTVQKSTEPTFDPTFDGRTRNASLHAKFFDETNPFYRPDAQYNLMTLRNLQRYAQDRLDADGFLFLNDVYDILKIPRTKAGQYVGWVSKELGGSGHVDFGIYNGYREGAREFVNGYERSILLDFNIDGEIMTKVFPDKPERIRKS